jgi:CspA family cold shock protein
MLGKVRWFEAKKGYGLIEPEDGAGDVFVHSVSITGDGSRTLEPGEKVQFEVVQAPYGRQATQVRRAATT